MDDKMIMDGIEKAVDAAVEKNLQKIVGDEVASSVKATVQKMRMDKQLYGQDLTGLDDADKKSFAEEVKSVAFGRTKANEGIIGEIDSRGGYLTPVEVSNGILRVAQSVGLVLSQASVFPMNSDELDIPSYRGSFLEGGYLGVDTAGDVSAMSFSMARLLTKKWQLAFVLGNDLLADANVDLANWLIALLAEAHANMVDKQAFAGTGAPFVGVLNDSNVATVTLATGKDTFAEYDVLTDSSNIIAQLEETLLDGAAFYMHRTVWGSLRTQKSSTGDFILPMAGAASNSVLANYPKAVALQPAGEILGHPVFTTRHLPALTSTAVSTKFMTFGNFKSFAYGDREAMRITRHTSGSFGGKEIALADQQGLVGLKRHALVNGLPAAFVNVKTAAS